MCDSNRLLLSGDEAIALAAFHAGVALGAGYPGTPSTEILEAFSEYGGQAQWSPNEKVALEVTLGVAFGGGRAGEGPNPGHGPGPAGEAGAGFAGPPFLSRARAGPCHRHQ